MASDSTERGYLLQQEKGPPYDIELDRLLSRWIRGVADYPEKMVRPRWTKYQVSLEDVDTDWCAFGVTGIRRDDTPALIGADNQELWRHETVDCMASFYGPNGLAKATQFTDAVTVEQNNETLKAAGFSLRHVEDVVPFPELINAQWVRRYDVRVHLRRKVIRSFAVKSLTDAPVQFFGE